jgi:Flp pilus assembly protein TadG
MNYCNKKGAALIETAFSLMILLIIVFGIVEYGRAMFIVNTLNNAAREGARRAAVSPSPIDIDDFVTSAIPFDKTGIDITTSTTMPTAGSGEAITVTITLPFEALTGIIPVPSSLRGEATMRYEL